MAADPARAPRLLPLPAPGLGAAARCACVFWRPNPDFVDQLAEFLRGKRVLEVFAGNGLLAGLLAQRGVDVLATSILSDYDGHSAGLYYPVEAQAASAAVAQHGAGRDVLLICWPTTTIDAVRAARAWGTGRDLVYIGETTNLAADQFGGCATDEFFAEVDFVSDFSAYRGNSLERAAVCRLRPHPGAKRLPTPLADTPL